MKYRKFIIKDYKAITGPLEINIEKNSLIPIIGVNECGKTTILNALFSFDYYNDTLNNKGRHLQDVQNLYKTSPPAGKISAEVELSLNEFNEVLKTFIETEEPEESETIEIDALEKKVDGTEETEMESDMHLVALEYQALFDTEIDFPGKLIITRNLGTKRYSIEEPEFYDAELNHEIVKDIIKYLPYTLYFDDFRDSVDERIEIVKNKEEASGWLKIFETLFKKTNKEFSLYDLPNQEERKRKSIISKVTKFLNGTLTREWQNFRLDTSDALRISIDYEEEGSSEDESKRYYLKIDVIETDESGDEHFFFIRDRSKGFYWFFNFVMKLEFNPKVVGASDIDAIYLLDEPGSYLHASAQGKLCKKLMTLSKDNIVIYCTHSHYLLDPEVIPINKVRIAEKDGQGSIKLVPIHEHTGNITEKRSAYQPLFDALRINPLKFEFSNDPVLIVEGIIDFYLLEIFKGDRKLRVLPSVGADSIKFYISIMIAWGIRYNALWDNDPEGIEKYDEAKKYFGDEEAAKHFRLLPLKPRGRKRIIQNLIAGDDLNKIREKLDIPRNKSFKKTVAEWYYSPLRDKITKQASDPTKQNFQELFEGLPICE